MPPFFALLLLFLRIVELRDVPAAHATLGVHAGSALDGDAGALAAWTEEPDHQGRVHVNRIESLRTAGSLKRIPRGAKDGHPRKRDPYAAINSYRHPRPHDPDGYFTTPQSDRHSSSELPGNSSLVRGTVFFHSPLFPVTDGSYGAYAVMLLALVVFAAGIVGNLALMCIVWHNYYLKNAWNSILAGLAFWDFLVLFFCLPVVVFHELTAKRLLGDVSCRVVPYMEVTSLGVATFSLCALSIDRFHAATSPRTLQMPQVEPCQSILAKLSVIWVGSMVLAAPELLLWQLTQEAISSSTKAQNSSPLAAPTSFPESQVGGSLAAASRAQTGVFLVDMCVRQPSMDLPENIYSLVLTYHEARMWWYFGCYFCLPLLFTLACNLVTRHVLAQHALQKQASSKVTRGCTSSCSSSSSSSTKKKQHMKREQRLSSTVTALAIMYAVCNLPENACNITLAYVKVPVSAAAEALLVLIGQFLLFVRCSATPVLLLCLCRSLGQAFMDCCCCCCEECLPDGGSSASSSASTTATAMSSSTSPSTLSSPTTPSPPSLSPSSVKEEKLKMVSETSPAIYYDRAKDTSVAIGTAC